MCVDGALGELVFVSLCGLWCGLCRLGLWYVCGGQLAERSKAPVEGTGPKGRGLESHIGQLAVWIIAYTSMSLLCEAHVVFRLCCLTAVSARPLHQLLTTDY